MARLYGEYLSAAALEREQVGGSRLRLALPADEFHHLLAAGTSLRNSQWRWGGDDLEHFH